MGGHKTGWGRDEGDWEGEASVMIMDSLSSFSFFIQLVLLSVLEIYFEFVMFTFSKGTSRDGPKIQMQMRKHQREREGSRDYNHIARTLSVPLPTPIPTSIMSALTYLTTSPYPTYQ